MTFVKVVANDPSYYSNFFYFAEISKMSELEPNNVDFSAISGNALISLKPIPGTKTSSNQKIRHIRRWP